MTMTECSRSNEPMYLDRSALNLRTKGEGEKGEKKKRQQVSQQKKKRTEEHQPTYLVGPSLSFFLPPENIMSTSSMYMTAGCIDGSFAT